MAARSPHTPAVDLDRPLDTFSNCHSGILSGLESFANLPELAHAAEQARTVAAATLAVFEHAVLVHHADEEGDLFPAVLHSAAAGEEHDRVKSMIKRLTAEHRAVETLWKKLKPEVKHAASGAHAALDTDEVATLVQSYYRHAAYEELEFLPLARDILGRNGNHMAALGLSLHMRHTPLPVGYI
jgi:hypothetical protein